MVQEMPPIGGPGDVPPCVLNPLFAAPHTKRDQRKAAAVCKSRCPVLEECRTQARRAKRAGEDVYGVWGGELYSLDREEDSDSCE